MKYLLIIILLLTGVSVNAMSQQECIEICTLKGYDYFYCTKVCGSILYDSNYTYKSCKEKCTEEGKSWIECVDECD